MATNSLPQLNTLQPISASAVHVLARMAARRAVQEQLRADGVRVTLVKPADIAAQAKVYLEQHPELYQQALERARLIDEMEEARKARRRKLSMVTPDRPVGNQISPDQALKSLQYFVTDLATFIALND